MRPLRLAAALLLLAALPARAETLTICLNQDAPPYSTRAHGGGGFDLAVSKAVAETLGRDLKPRWFESKLDEDSSGALEANALLSDGQCQLVAGYPLTEDSLAKPGAPTARLPDFDGFKPSDRRRRIPLGELRPSRAYHFAPLTVVLGTAGKGRAISGLRDLIGLKIGVEGGTLSDTILMTSANGALIDSVSHLVPGRDQLWPAFERGDFDATLTPLHRFDAYRAAHPDTGLRASGYIYPVGFNLGFVGLAGDPALLAEVDRALADLAAKGEIARIAQTVGMTYLPPHAPDVQRRLLLSDLKAP